MKDLNAGKKRLLIVGAGAAGTQVVRELKKNARAGIVVAGFVDDDPKKLGKAVRGITVMGAVGDIPRLIGELRVDQLLISTPSVAGLEKRVAQLVPPGFPIKILPSISSVILGHVDLSYIRDIHLGDIIGRPLVKADQQLISTRAKGKTFLVTGGAGSIGSEIVRQLYASQARAIVVLDAWEEGIFNLTEELQPEGRPLRGKPRLHMSIGNVRDKKRLEEVMRRFRVDVIVHAAAYKHVHLMEANPEESRKTNELGTKNMLDMAIRHGVRDFVLISTDKAVRPKSVMGKSKRAAELLMKRYAKKREGVRFCAVRFGNVLNSSGSMLPKFVRQIRTRSAITITHKDMTRYFMSIPEAVSLVLMAWKVSKNGQILILDMGRPVKIFELAEMLIKLHGLTPHEDIPIVEIGIRPGEKIHEELAYDTKKLRPSGADRVFIAEDVE